MYPPMYPPLRPLSLPARDLPSGSRRGSRSGPDDEEHAEMLLALEVGKSMGGSVDISANYVLPRTMRREGRLRPTTEPWHSW